MPFVVIREMDIQLGRQTSHIVDIVAIVVVIIVIAMLSILSDYVQAGRQASGRQVS